ncbi:uncharacterized protein LOC103190865 [Callorhinchus milii]|uniref:uncharacterized protein LOC103190865 n=1 Tax=Callorhinchus milii TaxID=7868 RepID=UPI001C3FAF8C|nr:uncharacterized protein LOC103190865 [Callorhinchus milii]XP_007909959.2 uncharacterized protein LOC103190865 [Callorhinchus milii]XP_007909960.2 uncharacterized protein LOC103190865 [Callorhinchus milii]
MDRYGMLIQLKETDEGKCQFPLESRSFLFGRNQKCDLNIVAPNVAGEHCKLEVNENNEVILRNLACAAPALLNGKPVSDAELVEAGDVITIFNHSFRFDSRESASVIAMSGTEETAQERFVSEELKWSRKARRNIAGKRKSRVSPLCEITLSSVENLDQKVKPQPQFSSSQQLQDDGLYEVPTLEGKMNKQLEDFVECRSRLDVHQETSDEMSESTRGDTTRGALLDLEFQSRKVTQADPLLHKSISPENKDIPVRGACGDGNDQSFLMLTDCSVTPCKPFSNNVRGSEGQELFVKKDKEEFSGPANQLQVPAEMSNPKPGGKQKTRFSRRASSVGARGSPETNSLICHIARQRMQAQESKRILLLKSMMEEAYKGSLQAEEEEKTPAPDVSVGDSKETGTPPITPCASDPPPKKKVTFGDELTPELFDKRLPSNTPLRKGGTPVQRKTVFSDSPRSVLKRGSKMGPITEYRTNSCKVIHSGYEPPFSPEINCGSAESLEQLAKMADNLDNDVKRPVDEGEGCQLRLNFNCLSPLEHSLGSEELQDCLKNHAYQEQLGDTAEMCEALKQNQGPMEADSISGFTKLPEPLIDIDAIYTNKMISEVVDQVANFYKVRKPRKRRTMQGNCKARNLSAKISQRKGNCKERAGRQASNKKSKPGGESITGEKSLIPILSVGDQQRASRFAIHPSLQDVLEETERNEDKIILFEQVDTTVKLSPVSEFTAEKIPGRERKRSETAELPRRSSRVRNNAKKDGDPSQTPAKGKRGRKVKVSLYGRREYASKKPLLSPIAEVFDELPELGDLTASVSPTENALNWSTSAPNITDDIPEESEQDLSATGLPANGCAVQHNVTERFGKKGQIRRTIIFCSEEQQVDLPPLKSETLEEVVNIVKSPLSEDSENTTAPMHDTEPHQSSAIGEIVDDEQKVTVSYVTRKRGQRGNLVVVNCGSEETADEGQVMSAGVMGLVEIVTDSTNQTAAPSPTCPLLLPESNVLEDLNKQVQDVAGETQQPALVLPAEALIVVVSPAAAMKEEISLSPPKARKVLQTRKGRRRRKLFALTEIACEEQPDETAERYLTEANGNNKVEKRRTKGRLSACRVIDEHDVADIDRARGITSFRIPFNAAEQDYSVERVDTDIFVAAGQLTTEDFDSGSREASRLRNRKKVRRSGRLSMSLNTEGLTWIESSIPEQAEKYTSPRSKATLRKLQQKSLSHANDGEVRSGGLTLGGGYLPCNGSGFEVAFDGAEEPPLKSILLD